MRQDEISCVSFDCEILWETQRTLIFQGIHPIFVSSYYQSSNINVIQISIARIDEAKKMLENFRLDVMDYRCFFFFFFEVVFEHGIQYGTSGRDYQRVSLDCFVFKLESYISQIPRIPKIQKMI